MDGDEGTELQSRYTDKDLAALRRLRNYYRREFANGKSDESFMLWVEDGLKVVDGQQGGSDGRTEHAGSNEAI